MRRRYTGSKLDEGMFTRDTVFNRKQNKEITEAFEDFVSQVMKVAGYGLPKGWEIAGGQAGNPWFNWIWAINTHDPATPEHRSIPLFGVSVQEYNKDVMMSTDEAFLRLVVETDPESEKLVDAKIWYDDMFGDDDGFDFYLGATEGDRIAAYVSRKMRNETRVDESASKWFIAVDGKEGGNLFDTLSSAKRTAEKMWERGEDGTIEIRKADDDGFCMRLKAVGNKIKFVEC